MFLKANPILEAFGNSKTRRNDDSSRFGRWMVVHFQEGKACGSEIVKYMLEKSWVVCVGQGESNFHVFYLMLLGLGEDRLNKLFLTSTPQLPPRRSEVQLNTKFSS